MLVFACLFAAWLRPILAQTEWVFPVGDAQVTAPMALVDGVLQQPVRTELPEGGTAVFSFNVSVAGDYIVRAVVDAPGGDANSVYVTVDTPASDHAMVWDIPFPYTKGFEEHVVTWRGTGNRDDAEFDPKVFALAAGEHRLIVTGREPTRLKSLTLQPYQGRTPGTLAFIQQAYHETNKQLRRELFRLQGAGGAGVEDESALYEKIRALHATQFAEALRIAEANVGRPQGLAALAWIVQTSPSGDDAGIQAVSQLTRDYAASPEVGEIVAYLSGEARFASDPALVGMKSLFESVARQNGDRTARGQATFGLALIAKRDFEALEATAQGEAVREAGRRAISLMEEVQRDFGDCPYLHEGRPLTLAQKAGQELVELRSLRKGMPAPDIVAPDLAGETFRLSDARGKVVVLVFWASWCSPCMQAVPREKELVERYQGRPFVLIGVNGDRQLAAAQQAVSKNQIPWRSFWAGPDGALAEAWNVRSWPTVYLIDHTGIIRQRVYFDESVLEDLVTSAEQTKDRVLQGRL